MIKLINNYYIDADSYQYILKQMVTRTKTADNTTYEAETTVGYFKDIPPLIKSCLDDIVRDELSTGEITSLLEYANKIESLNDELNSMLNPLDINKLATKITKWF